MIIQLKGSNQAEVPEIFEAMYRLREEVFANRLNWVSPSPDGLEKDEFDTDDTYYFAYIGTDDRMDACWRVVPTHQPYMLEKVFPVLLDGNSAPKAGNVWEISRLAVSGRAMEASGLGLMNRITQELVCSIYEFGPTVGMTEAVAVCEVSVARLLSRLGCQTLWTSRAHRIGQTITIAAIYDISASVHEVVKTRCQLHCPVLVDINATQPGNIRRTA